jgi:hypothetical protein
MMKTYRMEVRDTYTHMAEITAESEAKAKEIAWGLVGELDEMEREVYSEGEV